MGCPPLNSNIKVVYRDSSGHISGEQRGAGHYACVTGSDVTGSGPDRKWRHRKSSDRKWRHNRNYVLRMPGSAFPRFYLTIVVVQNVPLLMTVNSMAIGCDVTESDVTGSDVIIPKVDDSPWGDLNWSRCCIVRQGCFLSRPLSHCGISTK